MFFRYKIVHLIILLCSIISASWSVTSDRRTFTNDWVVKVKGGPAVADLIARRHGFVNKGQVICIHVDFHPRKYANSE